MKKILSIALTGILFLSLFAGVSSLPASATEGTCGENITWTLDGGTLTISGSGPMSYTNPYPWNEYGNSITAVVVESGVTEISDGAFATLRNVITVSLPASVWKISDYAFDGCISLTTAPLSNSITHIGGQAFRGCGLTEVTIPSSITYFGSSCFSSCRSLRSVTISQGVTTIGRDAFSGCSSLTSVTVPDSVTTMNGAVFSGCYNLQSVELSQNLTTMGGNTFSGCSRLTSVTLPDSVTAIGGYEFNGCTNLKSITIGAGVASVAESAFWKCPSLTSFTVSSSNPHFTTDQGVIYNKSKTELVRMPQGFQGSYSILPGTTKVWTYACYECTGLTALTIPGSVKTIEKYGFDWCTGLQSVSIANGLQTIGTFGFSYCKSLQEITFPPSVTTVDSSSFSGCVSLTKITFTGIAPMIREQAFSGVKATVYYPGNKAGWKDIQELYGGRLKWVATYDSCTGKHTEVTVSAKPATCTETGLTAGKQCSQCGIMTQEQQVVPATGHNYTDSWMQVVAPTETKEGLARRNCTKCGLGEEKKLPVLGSEVTQPEETETTLEGKPAEPTQAEQQQTQPEVTEREEIQPEQTVSGDKEEQEATIEEEEIFPSQPQEPTTPEQEQNGSDDAGKNPKKMIILVLAAVVSVGSLVAIFLIKREKI